MGRGESFGKVWGRVDAGWRGWVAPQEPLGGGAGQKLVFSLKNLMHCREKMFSGC